MYSRSAGGGHPPVAVAGILRHGSKAFTSRSKPAVPLMGCARLLPLTTGTPLRSSRSTAAASGTASQLVGSHNILNVASGNFGRTSLQLSFPRASRCMPIGMGPWFGPSISSSQSLSTSVFTKRSPDIRQRNTLKRFNCNCISCSSSQAGLCSESCSTTMEQCPLTSSGVSICDLPIAVLKFDTRNEGDKLPWTCLLPHGSAPTTTSNNSNSNIQDINPTTIPCSPLDGILDSHSAATTSTAINSTIDGTSHSIRKATPSFYRRPLPPQLVSFTSGEGKSLFKDCVQSGTAEIFFTLSGNFVMQSEPAFCGLGSLAMILNALAVDPGRRWKGVWRWYSDDMLECCPPLERIRESGITFDELASVARCNGLEVVPKRGDRISFEEFTKDLERVSRGSDEHMVISFSRKALGQTGEGHFSPVGAFHKESNKVLILDTARFKYPSYFCDARQLYEALHPLDPTTGKARGYMLLKNGGRNPNPLTRLDEVETLRRILLIHLPKLMKEKQPIKLGHFVSFFIEMLEKEGEQMPLAFTPPGVDLAAQTNADEIKTLHLNCISQVKRSLKALFPEVFRQDTGESYHINGKPMISQTNISEDQHALAFLFLIGIPSKLMQELDSAFLLEDWYSAVRSAQSNERLLEKEVNWVRSQLDEVLGLKATQ